jgi:hypothetical protein
MSVVKKSELIGEAIALFTEDSIAEGEKRQATNKDDRVRLIHLYADTDLSGKWDDTTKALTREDLEDSDFSPYSSLADAFNDYDTFYYAHAGWAFDATGDSIRQPA